MIINSDQTEGHKQYIDYKAKEYKLALSEYTGQINKNTIPLGKRGCECCDHP